MDDGEGQAGSRFRHCQSRCPSRPNGRPYLIAVDTNILIYAHREEFEQHIAAKSALKDLAEGSAVWALPVFVIGEFLRVVTHPRILIPPSTLKQALAAIDGLLRSPSARVFGPGDDPWPNLSAVLKESGVVGNMVFDAQIAALCVEHGIREILSEDRDFERFPGLTVNRL